MRYVEGRVYKIIMLNNMTYNDLIFKKFMGCVGNAQLSCIDYQMQPPSMRNYLKKVIKTPDTGYQWESY